MAKSKKENFKGMKEDELKKNLAVLREEMRVIRFKAEGSKSKNVKEADRTTAKKRKTTGQIPE